MSSSDAMFEASSSYFQYVNERAAQVIKALKTLKWYLSRKSMSGINSFKETYCSDIGLKVNPPSK